MCEYLLFEALKIILKGLVDTIGSFDVIVLDLAQP